MHPKPGKFYVTRQIEFSAAHRLYRHELSEERNRALFGACANPYGHGHNYSLEATFEGDLQPETKMVVHFASLKTLLHETVVAPLDHRHLNHDVAFLNDQLPTSENLVRTLWERIEVACAGQPWKLFRLKLMSSNRNWVEFYG